MQMNRRLLVLLATAGIMVPGRVAPGLVSVKNFLEERLGREVDVVTRDGIDPAVPERVCREAETVF